NSGMTITSFDTEFSGAALGHKSTAVALFVLDPVFNEAYGTTDLHVQTNAPHEHEKARKHLLNAEYVMPLDFWQKKNPGDWMRVAKSIATEGQLNKEMQLARDLYGENKLRDIWFYNGHYVFNYLTLTTLMKMNTAPYLRDGVETIRAKQQADQAFHAQALADLPHAAPGSSVKVVELSSVRSGALRPRQ
ncbi:MAG TPA: hypothetical protein VIN59_09840, partial [Alphaproteobacteria bacterium]